MKRPEDNEMPGGCGVERHARPVGFAVGVRWPQFAPVRDGADDGLNRTGVDATQRDESGWLASEGDRDKPVSNPASPQVYLKTLKKETMMLPWISFNKASCGGGRFFSWERLYFKTTGYRKRFFWTPFILLWRRYANEKA